MDSKLVSVCILGAIASMCVVKAMLSEYLLRLMREQVADYKKLVAAQESYIATLKELLKVQDRSLALYRAKNNRVDTSVGAYKQ